MSFLSEDVKITIDAPTATGTTDVESTTLDMSGYDGVLWIVRLGSPAANNNIRAQQDTASNMAAAADIAGTLVNDDDDEEVFLDLTRPREQYVRCHIERGTTTTVDTIVAIQYKARRLPVMQTVTGERHHASAEGTA